MQETAASELVLLAQIEVERFVESFWWQAQALLLGLKVALQRDRGGLFRHLTEQFAHNETRRDEPQWSVATETENSARGFVELLQAGNNAAAKTRGGIGQARSFDDAGGPAFEVLAAVHRRHARNAPRG